MTDKPQDNRPSNKRKGPNVPKVSKRARVPRTIGTNVGQAIKDAQAARVEAKRAEQAAIMRKMAGAAK